jgi:hypothetical protein
VPEVDVLRLILEDLEFAASVIVAFLEGCEGAGGAAAEAERGLQLAPVELLGRPGLLERESKLVNCAAGGVEAQGKAGQA